MAQREIRYCTTEDGARIAYCVEGDGPTTILALPALNESFSLDHLMPVSQQFYRELGRGRRLVRFDWRGQGLSADGQPLSGGVWMDGVMDLRAVATAVGSPVTLWVPTNSGPTALRFAGEHPNLVEGVILYGTYAHADDAIDLSMRSAIWTLAAANWKVAMQTVADLNGRRDFPVEAAELGEWYARSETQEHFVMRSQRYQAGDLQDRPDLSRVGAPCLVLHRMGDPAIRFQAGQVLAAGIPNCRFIPLAGDRHLYCLGDYSDILAAVDEFIGDRDGALTPQPPLPLRERGSHAAASQASGTAIILFTDIADSTALTERLGDVRFRDASRALDVGLRAVIREAGGEAIEGKLLGDGVLATFASTAQAIDGARRCLALSAASELGLHIGLHAGDVIREDNNVFGGAVNIASRICGLSAPGEILVSDVVRGMGRSSAGVEFEDCGEHEMKGVGEPVRVYVVRTDGGRGTD